MSVKGRFHAFYLAHQFFKRGMLNQLITSYPRFEVVKYSFPKNIVSSILSNEILSRRFNVLSKFYGSAQISSIVEINSSCCAKRMSRMDADTSEF